MALKSLTAVLTAALLFGAGQRAVASDPEKATIDCRASAGTCVKTIDGITITFDISPKPVKVMNDLTFAVTLTTKDKPVRGASVMIDLTMPGMFMGKNAVKLKEGTEGAHTGRGVIVRCPSGEKTWQASVVVRRADKTTIAAFTFEVI